MKVFTSFQCKKEKCTNSCCGEFNGFSDKLVSVERRSFKDIILTTQDVDRLSGSVYEKYIFTGNDCIKRIKTDDEGVCVAYQEGKCSMNALKPTICRCFPLYLDAFVGLCAFKDCPSVENTYVIEDYMNEIEDLFDMYEFWISYYKNIISQHK